MKTLNKQQIEYAESRVYNYFSDKKEAIKDRLTTGEDLTGEKRAQLIKTGKVKIKKGITRIREYDDVVDVFDFSQFEKKFDKKKYNAECKKLDKESQKLIDKLMLGDVEEALKMIEQLK